jgi:hypothetical protein
MTSTTYLFGGVTTSVKTLKLSHNLWNALPVNANSSVNQTIYFSGDSTPHTRIGSGTSTNDGTGGGTTTPPASDTGGGGTTTPPASDTGGGGTTTPPASDTGGGGTTTPPASDTGGGGTTTPPASDTGGGTTTPPAGDTGGGTTTPPAGDTGGGTTTPPAGDTGDDGLKWWHIVLIVLLGGVGFAIRKKNSN